MNDDSTGTREFNREVDQLVLDVQPGWANYFTVNSTIDNSHVY